MIGIEGPQNHPRPNDDGTLIVVPTEQHRERLGRRGMRAETRASLLVRLCAELAPGVELAGPEATRIALSAALTRVADRDTLLAPLARGGGPSWRRTIDAVDDALASLRASGTTRATLAKVALAGGSAGTRAGTLLAAMEALEQELGRAKLVDGRAAGAVLARAIVGAPPAAVGVAVGANRVVARWIVAWDASDLAWWRALDAALVRSRGSARIELPSFQRALDSARERDPLEVLSDEIARALDDAPMAAIIAAPLGDLGAMREVPEHAATRIELRACADAQGQARAALDAVHEALARGVPVDRIAIGVPRIDEEVIGPLRRLFDEARIVTHDPRGRAPVTTGVVACALQALSVGARGLPREEVAEILRSQHIDPCIVTNLEDRREAAIALRDVARALEQTPSAAASDPVEALAATALAWRARSDRPGDAEVDAARGERARQVGQLLARVEAARTHAEHAAAARRVWSDLGLGVRNGGGIRRTLAADKPPSGIARAELRALAEDAHAWEVLHSALDAHEAAAARLGFENTPIAPDAFRHHLTRALEAGEPLPGAARAAAVRIARLTELAADTLALLVVVDANDGVIPAAASVDPLLPDALLTRLREIDPAGAPPPTAVRRARELAGLALAASSAERIVLTFRLRDEQGASMTPMPLVAWLDRAGVPKTSWRASPVPLRPLTAADAILRRLVDAPDDASVLAPDAARRAEIERRRESFFYDPSRALDVVVGRLDVDEALARALAEETGGAERALSVTALERFARCPFQGYAAKILGASERRRHRDLPDVREEGTLVHEALAAAFLATQDLWRPRPRDATAIVTRGLAAADEILKREEGASVLRNLVIEGVREDVRGVLAWSIQDEDWDFRAAEQAFGESSPDSWPPLRMRAGTLSLLLRGKIDRVDVGHLRAAVRAIDYKRSKRVALEGAKDLGETAFQIPLYARAAAQHLAREELSGLYVPTGARDLAPDYRPKSAFAARWAEIFADEDGEPRVVRVALGIIQGLRAGVLTPTPHDHQACTYCGFHGGCRKPRFAIAPADDEVASPKAP